MLWVELYTADKETCIGYVPMSHKLSEYYSAAVSVMQRPSNPADDDDFDLDDPQRDNQLLRAEFITVADRYQRGDHSTESHMDLNRLVLAFILGDPILMGTFMVMGRSHVIQMAVPASVNDDPAVQWRKPREDEFEQIMRDFADGSDESIKLLREYIEQAREIGDLCRAEIQMLKGKIQ